MLEAAVHTIPYPHWLDPGRQHVAAGRRHVRRPDEPARPGRALRRAGPAEMGGQHAAHAVRRLQPGADRVGAVGLQHGVRATRPTVRSEGDRVGSPTWSANPHPIVTHFGEQNQAVSGANTLIPFHFPTSTLAYFQFVFAAITPLLFCGSIVGRMKFKAWLLMVPLWTTFVYAVNAKLLWGGGFLAQHGAVDYSGGYVIHMSAGVSGFVARGHGRQTALPGPTARRAQQPDAGGGRAPASCGWAGTGSTAVTRTTPGWTRRPPCSTPTSPRPRPSSPGCSWTWCSSEAEEADVPRGHQRHDLRSGGDHPVAPAGSTATAPSSSA